MTSTHLYDEAAVGLCVEASVGHVGLCRVGGHPGDAAVGGADTAAGAALLQIAGTALFPQPKPLRRQTAVNSQKGVREEAERGRAERRQSQVPHINQESDRSRESDRSSESDIIQESGGIKESGSSQSYT